MTRLALYLLGAPCLELGGEVISLSHHKAMALLAYLGVTRQRGAGTPGARIPPTRLN